MQQEKNIDLADYLVLFVKHKKFLIGITFLVMVFSYLAIFFLVEEQFDSSATIIPSEDQSMSGIMGMLGDLQGLPLGLGGSSNPEIGLYNTIIYSRSNLENIIEKFNLLEDYHIRKNYLEGYEKAIERLSNSITAEETDEGAFQIKVRMLSAQKAADVANFIITSLNNKIIELKVKKSKNNRVFLGKRLDEVKLKLKNSEDSLRIYQEKSGIYDPTEQVKGIIGTYSQLETEVITKQIQKSILENIVDKDSPELTSINVQVEEFQKKIEDIRAGKQKNSMLMSFNSIPKKALDYYRYLRDVEINNAILQFMLPLYEQSRLEEQKDIPVLQIIDNAKPPAKKSFPSRTILTLLVGMSTFFIVFIFIVFRENENFLNSEKMLFVRRNLFKWKVS
ncbi:MAG: hypothetical protein JEY94_02645 [Melioribacteraceae bacterium]|nr:hypothetical protein [Melioribacteraceae bacterium]